MAPQPQDQSPPTCLRSVMMIVLGAIPVGLLLFSTILFSTPNFSPVFFLAVGVLLLELVCFVAYWLGSSKPINSCFVVLVLLFFLGLFILGFFIYLGDLIASLQHSRL